MSDQMISNRGLRDNAGLRLMVLFGSFCFTIGIAAAVAALLTGFAGLDERVALLLSSVVQCVFAFCLPAWLTARFSSNTPWKWLGLETVAPFKAFAGVVILYALVLPAMNQLIAWNANLHFPDWASGLETTLRSWEEANGSMSGKILSYTGIGGMIATVSVVGLLTGFSEEIFFRGALQGIFQRCHISRWVAVWGAAAIFSAIHFQFFGFVPRLLMGAMFGYLFIWSGSLWLPVFAHALNNSIVVITTGITGTENGVDTLGISGDGEFPVAALASAAATFLFLWRFRRYFFYKG